MTTSGTNRRPSFIGRREELAFLYDAFERSRDERAHFVPVEGEAGIGKSRLIAEFTASLADRASIACGNCSEQIRSPYRPFVDLLGRLDARSVPQQDAALDRRSKGEQKAAFFERAVRTLSRAGARKPVVAVLEDLQWADSATLELLAYLLQNLGTARVLFIVTLRTEGASANRALAAFRHRAARQHVIALTLHGLRRSEIRHLVAGALGPDGSAVSPDTLTRIETLAEGNPLFAEELAHAVRESGELNLARNAPLSLQAMLSERLAPLTDRDRAVLVRAAIAGQQFDAGFLARIVGMAADDVLTIVQRAVEAGLVVPSARDPFSFSFRHAMIRQSLADQLIVGLAAPLHVSIARELAELPDAPARSAELAYHWSAAREPSQARHYNELAAESAWNVYAYRDAIGFYSAALRWDYPPGARRAGVYERLGTLLYIEGTGEEPAQWYERCRDEYAALRDVEGTAQALLRLADQYWVDARTGQSLEAAAAAAALLTPETAPALYAEALLSQARYCITLGDPPAAQALLQSAAAYRERFDSALEMTFHEVCGETHAALGQARDAFHDFAVASHLAAAVGTSELIAQVENNFALVASDLGEFDLATQRHRIALTEARRTSMPWRVAYCALNYAHTLTLRGDLTAARSLVWEALDSGVTTATFFTKVAAVGIPLALLLNDRQLLDACARDEALSFAARSKETQRIASVAAAFADWKTAIGSPGEARAVVRDAREHIGRPHRCTTLFLHIAAAGTADDRRWARATLPASGVRPRMRRACNVLLLAADFAASGDRAQAKRFGAAAARAFSRLGMPLHEARALELSDCAAAALERYAAMGNVRDTERLRQRSQTPATGVALSARQLEVARLVAQGQTNRAIASRLHISEHTVEHHLSTIFERLGLHSRSALAAKIGDVPTPT